MENRLRILIVSPKCPDAQTVRLTVLTLDLCVIFHARVIKIP